MLAAVSVRPQTTPPSSPIITKQTDGAELDALVTPLAGSTVPFVRLTAECR